MATDLNARVLELERLLEEETAAKDELEVNIQVLREELHDVEETMQLDQESSKGKITELEKTIATLRSELDEKTSIIAQLEADLGDSQRRLESEGR